MANDEKTPTDALRDHVAQSFATAKPGPSEVTDSAAEAVYGYLFPFLEDAEDPAEAVAAASAGAILGTKKHGAALWHVARGAMVGSLHAGYGRRLELDPLIVAGTRRMMGEADGMGADFGATAQGSVEGAITAAEELGLDPRELAATAARAALEMSEGLGEGALEKIRHLVDRPILGVPVQIPARYAVRDRAS